MPQGDPIGPAVAAATDRLRASGSSSPRLDAELLVAHVSGRDRSWVIAHPEERLNPGELRQLEDAVARRSAGEPIAYIRGYKEWQSLRIRTDRRALIPRPETELLADAAIADLEARLVDGGAPIIAWEVATGSGAVTVALARRFSSEARVGTLHLIASDLSAEALELAAENLADHGCKDVVTLACADLLDPAGATLPRPDLVVANLPYVASDEVDRRLGSLGHEPRIALDGGDDGLTVLRRLMISLPERASPRATVLLEIGVGQALDIASLSPAGARMSIVPDLAGLDRVVRIELGA